MAEKCFCDEIECNFCKILTIPASQGQKGGYQKNSFWASPDPSITSNILFGAKYHVPRTFKTTLLSNNLYRVKSLSVHLSTWFETPQMKQDSEVCICSPPSPCQWPCQPQPAGGRPCNGPCTVQWNSWRSCPCHWHNSDKSLFCSMRPQGLGPGIVSVKPLLHSHASALYVGSSSCSLFWRTLPHVLGTNRTETTGCCGLQILIFVCVPVTSVFCLHFSFLMHLESVCLAQQLLLVSLPHPLCCSPVDVKVSMMSVLVSMSTNSQVFFERQATS